jgi:nuclease S1
MRQGSSQSYRSPYAQSCPEGNVFSHPIGRPRHYAVILLALLMTAGPALGWGPEGHRAVAMIAAKNLTPEARDKVQAMLTPHDTLAALSVWADDVREEHSETGPWHYIDIPLAASTVDMEHACQAGNCVVAKIAEFESVLKIKSNDPALRREALEFVVHFVGDLHQPLHCADNNDQGGNKVQVIFFGQPGNLHAVWDGGIIRREKQYGAQLAAALESRITPDQRAAWARGSVEDWAMESHALAVKVAYGKLPPAVTPNLADDYVNATLPVVEEQIEKAGIRLAHLLNEALGN